ncbi:MAG: hypothetical protein JSV88_14060, partial [Candidatus Aminicenantes bacterium]
LGDVEKEKLFNIIKYYSGFYFVKPIGLTIMSNHFHLLGSMKRKNIVQTVSTYTYNIYGK